jgi:hypothetical protein
MVKSDTQAVVKQMARSLSLSSHEGRAQRCNTMSKEDCCEKEEWEAKGRDELTQRSKLHSSTRETSVPSRADSSEAADKLKTDPLNSTNALYAMSLLKDDLHVAPDVVGNVKTRMSLSAPMVEAVHHAKGGALTQREIEEIRKGLLREAGCQNLIKQLEEKKKVNNDIVKDIKMSESGVNFFKNIFYGEMPPILGKDDEQYKDLRKVIRAADSALFVNADAEEHFSVRDWFTSRGIQPRPTYTCSLISHSDLILGQGPNGGHGGTGIYKDNVEKSQTSMQQHLTRMTSHVKELWMSGRDINKRIFHRVNRDEEVLGFLVGLKEMKVGTVIALGFPRSYNMTNIKTMIHSEHGYADYEMFSKPAFQALDRDDTVYHRNTARDFFNYFGAKDGDDGLPWQNAGPGVRKCQLQEFCLTSTLVKTLKNNLGSEMHVYDLRVNWTDGCLCASVAQELNLQVVNIRTWDQGPSLLVKDQVHALVDTLLDFDAENSFVFIHCAGGIGRTGNIAYGLSEILCSNVPNDPLKKLEWLRSQRQGCIQSPEQLVDGMILSNMILDDVVNRCVSKS